MAVARPRPPFAVAYTTGSLLCCLVYHAVANPITLLNTAQPPQPLWLADVAGTGELTWCYDTPLPQPVCVTTATDTETSSTQHTTSRTSTTSQTSLSSVSVTFTSTSTCFKYEDCFTSCDELTEYGNLCGIGFCPTCAHAHMCDTYCSVCATNITETETTTTSVSTTTGTFTASTTMSSSTTTTGTETTATTSTATDTITSSMTSETVCVSYNILDDAICQQACLQDDACDAHLCNTIFCPTCNSHFAGHCDKQCGFCTTVTNTSSTSTSMSSVTTSGTSRTTSETVTSTTTSITSTTATTTTSASTGSTITSTLTSSTTSESSVSVTTESSTTTASSTTCFKYGDCISTCAQLAAVSPDICDTLFCPSCPSAHTCDTTCAICAGNVTTTVTTTDSSTTSATEVTLTFSSITSTGTTGTSITTSATTTTTETTFSQCNSVDLKPTALCQLTCDSTSGGCDEPCSTLFCPDCPGHNAGLCDKTCGFCTSHTNTSSTTITSESVTFTSATTVTTSSVHTSTGSSTTSASSGTSVTTTETTGTTTRTTFSRTTFTVTTTTGSSTTSATTTTCDKLADCLSDYTDPVTGNTTAGCFPMAWACDIQFCPTCPTPHLCDTTCGFCVINATSTETITATSSMSTTSETATITLTTTVTTGSRTTTTASSTASSSTSASSATDTSCVMINKNDTFCDNSCAPPYPGYATCPTVTCDTVFCPTCALAGYCDRSCNFCTNKLTDTTTSASSSTTITHTTTATTTTVTCTPCVIAVDYPYVGCDGLIPCGSTCQAVLTAFVSPCTRPLTLEFACSADQGFSSTATFDLGATWSSSSYLAAWGGNASSAGILDGYRPAHLSGVTGEFDLLCQSCGIVQEDMATWDRDHTCHQIDVNLTWGPNILADQVNEDVIRGYGIYLVDSCTDPFSAHNTRKELLTVDVLPDTGGCAAMSAQQCTCSCKDKYQVDVIAELPPSGDWRLMVVPILHDGTVLPFGLTTEVLVDRCDYSSIIDLDFCFANPVPTSELYLSCPGRSTTETGTSTSTGTSSTTATSTVTRTSSTSFTHTTCFKYADCWTTCEEMLEATPAVCVMMFCPSCPLARQCDTTCGWCALNTTTSATSSATASSTTTGTTTATTASDTSTSTLSTFSQTTVSQTTTTSASTATDTPCYMEDIMGPSFCNETCDEGGSCYEFDVCANLYCPSCNTPWAGMCDKTCGFCTTLTQSSSTSVTSSSATSTETFSSRTTKTTTITFTTNSGTTTSVTTSSATSSTTITATYHTFTDTSVSTTRSSISSTTSFTGCFTYEDCLPNCEVIFSMVGSQKAQVCDLLYCPTCTAARMCDTACGICAGNTTTTESATSTTTKSSFTTSGSSTTSLTTSSGTTTSSISTVSGTSVTTATLTSATRCESVNIMSDFFCNATYCPAGDDSCTVGTATGDACVDLFAPYATSAFAGMCDKTCGYCSTITNSSTTSMTSTVTSFSTTRTFTTTSSTTTSGSSSTSLSTASTSATTESTTTTVTTTTSTFTTQTTTDSSTTSSTNTTTTAFKCPDCLLTCPEMAATGTCDTAFCPTCSGAGLCDSSCGFIATGLCLNITDTTTATLTTTSVSATSTSETVSTISSSVTTVTTITGTSVTTTTATATSQTLCNATDFNATFCSLTCADPTGGDAPCPKDVCETLFCPTCHFPGFCDQECNYCTNKLTATGTSSSTMTSSSITTTSMSSTATCEPCGVALNIPLVGCDDVIPCGQSCIAVAWNTTCVGPMEMEFYCSPDYADDETVYENWSIMPPWAQGSAISAYGPYARSERWGGFGSSHDKRGAKVVNVTGTFEVKCAVCGAQEWTNRGNMSLDEYVDTDGGCDQVYMNLSWGPNVFVSSSVQEPSNASVDETGIAGYAVFLVSDCEEKLLQFASLANALAYVNVSDPGSPINSMLASECSCSGVEKYSAMVNATLIPGQDMRFMIVPVLDSGEVIPVGLTTDVIVDRCDSTTTTTQTCFSCTETNTSTSETSTMSSTVTTTSATTSTSTTTALYVVSGSLAVSAVGSQDDVEAAMIAALAALLGVPMSWISVDATPVRARSLSGGGIVVQLPLQSYTMLYEVTADTQGSQAVQQQMQTYINSTDGASAFQNDVSMYWSGNSTIYSVDAVFEPELLPVTATSTLTDTATSATTATVSATSSTSVTATDTATSSATRTATTGSWPTETTLTSLTSVTATTGSFSTTSSTSSIASSTTSATTTASTTSGTTGSATSGTSTLSSTIVTTTLSTVTSSSGTSATSTDSVTSTTGTGTSGTSGTGVTASATLTSTSVTQVSSTATTYTAGPTTSISGSFSFTGDVAEEQVSSASVDALAELYNVVKSRVTVVVTASESDGRRLASAFDVEYEVMATAFQAQVTGASNFDQSAMASLQSRLSAQLGTAVTVTAFSTPTLEVVSTFTAASNTGSGSSTAKASSDMLPIIIGIAGAVVLLVVIAAVVCKKRGLRSREAGAAGPAAHQGDNHVIDTESDGRQGPDRVLDPAVEHGQAIQQDLGAAERRALSVLGLTPSDAARVGIIAARQDAQEIDANQARALSTLGLTVDEGIRMGIVNTQQGVHQAMSPPHHRILDWDVDEQGFDDDEVSV